MGRSIPFITHRLDSKLSQWEKFSKLLTVREAFKELVSVIRNSK